MPKKTDDRLEKLKLVHETLEMMIKLLKDLGFEPPLEISQYQGTNTEKAATLDNERLLSIYQGYASLLKDREKYQLEIDSLVAQNAEKLAAAVKNGPAKKKATTKRTKRRGGPWARPRKRRRQPEVVSSEIVPNEDAV
ncbi:hypothetical protein MKX08_003659 [Trichoderma sp. CBMAI-0020]|nr:hypothetical protein MKX08_003659 [Trichoderma sp. CBMAI-0020]